MVYQEVEFRAFKRFAMCDCGGRLTYTPGDYITTRGLYDAETYVHDCDKCKGTFTLEERSPTIITKEVLK